MSNKVKQISIKWDGSVTEGEDVIVRYNHYVHRSENFWFLIKKFQNIGTAHSQPII